MATNFSDRGKAAEGLLKAYFEKLSKQQAFTYYRLPDAHAGSMVATIADFMFLHQGGFALVECKSVRHDYRLPHGNFDAGQVARMRMWKLSGATSFVMIYHETLGQWRSYDVDYFTRREGGSWDLRDTNPTTLEKAFNNYALNCLE